MDVLLGGLLAGLESAAAVAEVEEVGVVGLAGPRLDRPMVLTPRLGRGGAGGGGSQLGALPQDGNVPTSDVSHGLVIDLQDLVG